VGRSICDLDHWLRQFEGRSRSALLDRVTDFAGDAPLLEKLVDVVESGDPQPQIAAAVLLKAYQRKGIVFPQALAARLIDLIPALVEWQARLLVLQMLPALAIPSSHADALSDSLHGLLSNSNIFVRAWAYTGLHRLAVLFPEYRSEVIPLLNAAAKSESASVRARLRQLASLKK
jgi:hypothetical protein